MSVTMETCLPNMKLGFKNAFHRFLYILEDDFKVWAVAVRRVFGFLARAQHDRLALFGGEAQRRDAGSFALVSAVTERLKKRDARAWNDPTSPLASPTPAEPSPVSDCVRRRTRRSVSQRKPSPDRAAGPQGRARWTAAVSAPEGDSDHQVRLRTDGRTDGGPAFDTLAQRSALRAKIKNT